MGETLESIIEQTRCLKHMTIADLTKGAGLSVATYNRMRQDQADIKLTAVMALLDELRLQVADIAPALTTAYFGYERWQRRIEQTLNAVVRKQQPPAALDSLQRELTKAASADSGLAIFQLYLKLMRAKLADRQEVARIAAQQLYGKLCDRSCWTHWEYQQCLPILNYLTWPQLQQVYTKFIAAAPETLDEALLNAEYLAMVTNTLMHKDTAALKTVISWCQSRQLASSNLTFLVYLKFFSVLESRLHGDLHAGSDWARLQQRVLRLWAGQISAPLQIMQRMWQLAQGLKDEASGELSSIKPQTSGTVPPASAVDWIDSLRQAKQLPAEHLWQVLFISKAAYYRQFSCDDKLKYNEFFKALGSLQLESDDLTANSACLGLKVCAAQQALQRDVARQKAGQKPMQTAAAWQIMLHSQFLKTRNVGYQQLSQWLQMVEAEAHQDTETASQFALRLYRELRGYEGWNAFEYSLVISILPYLPITQGQFLFGHYLNIVDKTPAKLAVSAPQELDRLYLGLLKSALASGKTSSLYQVLKWIKTRPIPNQDLDFRIWQRFAAALLAEPFDTHAFELLLVDVAALCGRQMSPLCSQLRQSWQQACQILESKLKQA